MSNVTSLGRVLPLFKGNYVNSTEYNKLDVVLSEGSSYVSIIDSNTGHTPAPDSNYWKLIAVKGQQGNQGMTGDFGIPTTSAESIAYNEEPVVTITQDPSSPVTARVYNFDFKIPAGKIGFDSVDASAVAGQAGTQPRVSASLEQISENNRQLQFAFTIPEADGSGVTQVDGITPTAGNVELLAVQYRNQTLTSDQKNTVLNNIGAQPAGLYISEPISPAANNVLKYNGTTWVAGSVNEVPSSGTTGNFLKKTASGSEWAAVREVPAGSSSEIGRYLQYTSTGVAWRSVQALPSSGTTGAPLIKGSNSDYDVTWGSIMTNGEIDDMMGISNNS